MPRFDQTGPMGFGPNTGRGLGPCGLGMGYGAGFGRGFGWRRFVSKKEEEEMLTNEMEDLKAEIEAIKERLEEIKSAK